MLLKREDLATEGRRMAGTIAAPAEADFTSGPIAFALDVRAEDRSIHVAGWMHTIVQGECHRCLKATRLAVERDLRLEFRPREVAPDDEEHELDADDLDIDYYPEDGLDLWAVLAEQVLLGLPMKVLCGEECRGLCPQCGTDRNREPCDCEPPTDPRLADLADLRDRL